MILQVQTLILIKIKTIHRTSTPLRLEAYLRNMDFQQILGHKKGFIRNNKPSTIQTATVTTTRTHNWNHPGPTTLMECWPMLIMVHVHVQQVATLRVCTNNNLNNPVLQAMLHNISPHCSTSTQTNNSEKCNRTAATHIWHSVLVVNCHICNCHICFNISINSGSKKTSSLVLVASNLTGNRVDTATITLHHLLNLRFERNGVANQVPKIKKLWRENQGPLMLQRPLI